MWVCENCNTNNADCLPKCQNCSVEKTSLSDSVSVLMEEYKREYIPYYPTSVGFIMIALKIAALIIVALGLFKGFSGCLIADYLGEASFEFNLIIFAQLFSYYLFAALLCFALAHIIKLLVDIWFNTYKTSAHTYAAMKLAEKNAKE